MTNNSTDDFPRDPARFKERADRECVNWPAALTRKAHNAWHALEQHPSHPASEIDGFFTALADYRAANKG